MPDIKFACPHCQQHIEAEPGYAGLQIACPACRGSIVVPGTPAPSVPAPVAVSAPAYASARPSPLTVAPTQAPAPAASGCPSCGGALPHGAVLCTNCGYNLATGQRIVAGRPAARGKPGSPQWETPWYKTAYPYAAVVLFAFGILYLLGRTNEAVMMACVGIGALYVLTVQIIVIVAAFKEGVGTGFLTLCVPFYAVYFVFKTSESNTLKILFGVSVIINIALQFLIKPFKIQ